MQWQLTLGFFSHQYWQKKIRTMVGFCNRTIFKKLVPTKPPSRLFQKLKTKIQKTSRGVGAKLEMSHIYRLWFAIKYMHDLPYFFNIRISTIHVQVVTTWKWTQANPLPWHQIRLQINAVLLSTSNYICTRNSIPNFFNPLHICNWGQMLEKQS